MAAAQARPRTPMEAPRAPAAQREGRPVEAARGGSGGVGGATGGTGGAPDGSAGSAGSAGTGGYFWRRRFRRRGRSNGSDGGVHAAADVSLDGAGGSAGSGSDGGSDASGEANDDAPVDALDDSALPDADGATSADGSDAATLSVARCPKNTVLLVGQSMSFTSDVAGTANQSVFYGIVGGTSGGGSDSGSVDRGTIGSNGLYTAPAAPGTYQVVAKSQQDTSISDTATVTVVADNAVPTVRGTIAGPAGSGRIFVSIKEWQGGSTVLDAPGPYVIRGVTVNPSFTNITVAAYRDLAGVGTYLTSVDPYGQATVSWNGTTATGADVTLVNPPSPSFAQGPSRLIVWPTDGGVIAQWERIRGVDGKEVPEGYRLYASTSPNPGPDGGTSIVKTLRAGSSDIAVLSLTNGTPFYFAISAFTGTTESPLSPVVGPITPAPPTGGHSISGSVSFGFPSSGTLYVFAVGSGMSLMGQKIVNPQSPQSFAISGLPDGRYDIGAFFDRDDDGQVAANDPLTFRRQEGLPTVAVTGADVSNVSLSWPGPDGAAWVCSQYRREGLSTPSYTVRLAVGPSAKRVDRAVLIGGPGVVPPIDMRPRDDGVYQWDHNVGQVPPSVGANYNFELTYEDGKTCNLNAAVTGVWTSLPTALQPSGADAGSATPTFVWLAPSVTPPTFWYRMNVWQTGASDLWWTGFPSTYSSVVYNDDGRASSPMLISVMHSWAIVATDSNGNIAAHLITFGVP